MWVLRTRTSPSALRELRTGQTSGSRTWLGGFVLFVIAVVSCTSAPQTVPKTPAAARPSFGQDLSLGITLGRALTAGDKAVTAKFALTNNGSAVFEGCFGPSWGVSVIVGGHNAGYMVGADPSCVERLTVLPRQTIVWSKTVPLNNLGPGSAKVTAWVKVVDPAACGQRAGCHEVSVASPLMKVAVGGM